MTDSDKSVLRLAIMQLHEIRKNYINGLEVDISMIDSLSRALQKVLENSNG